MILKMATMPSRNSNYSWILISLPVGSYLRKCTPDEVSILYEYTTPMLLKAMYYGGGPGYTTLQEITGTSNNDYNNIILHIAVSQIYATMAMPSKGGKAGWGSTRSALNDAYEGANQTARNLAIRFAKAIAGKSIPGAYDGYRIYVAHYDDDSVQDFVFADFPPITPPQTGRLTVEKYSNQQSVTDNMTAFIVYYSLKGAKFQVLDSKNKLVATLTTDQNGEADAELPPGTYTVTESRSPLSYKINNERKPVKVEAGKESEPVRFAEEPVKASISASAIERIFMLLFFIFVSFLLTIIRPSSCIISYPSRASSRSGCRCP